MSSQASAKTKHESLPQTNISPPPESAGQLTLVQAVKEVTDELDDTRANWAPMLPEIIKPERFRASIVTALNRDPELLRADRPSLMIAAAKCAIDGLLPDGREGVLLAFNTKVKVKVAHPQTGNITTQERYKNIVVWMPMVFGITKKALGSGAVLGLRGRVVYTEEVSQKLFRYTIERGRDIINHEPILVGDRGAPCIAYATADLHSGILEAEMLRAEDVEKIKSVSRAEKGDLWTKWIDEAWKKSAIRRLSKRLNFPDDVRRVIERDDELTIYNQDPDEIPVVEEAPTQSRTIAAALMGAEGFTGEGAPAPAESEPVTAIEGDKPEAASSETVEAELVPPADEPSEDDLLLRVKELGRQAAAMGTPELKKWWVGLAEDVRDKLVAFKDAELKPEAAKRDLALADF